MKSRKGQSMIEYAITLASLVVVVTVFWYLFDVIKVYSANSTEMVNLEYP
ncbi:MAG: hypothetical protein MJ109_00600 [Kiritimatiellae bacterium]|nr:hypothetical protein [Kiritimatiellia bacterium]